MTATLNQLKAFRSIVATGSFQGAATLLNLSQPSVSQRVRELEAALGTRLFLRRGPRISLTADGHALIEHADRVLAAATTLQERFRTGDEMRGQLRIGLSENFALNGLADLLDRLQTHYPRITASVLVGDSGTLSRLLNGRELDLAIVSEPTVEAHVIREPVGLSRLGWFASRAGHPDTDPATPADLARHHLMIPSASSRLFTTVNRWFADSGVVPSRVSVCNNVAVTKIAVLHGSVIAIVPVRVMAQEVAARLVRQLAVTPELPSHRVSICYQQSEAGVRMSTFVSLIRDLIREHRIFAPADGLASA